LPPENGAGRQFPYSFSGVGKTQRKEDTGMHDNKLEERLDLSPATPELTLEEFSVTELEERLEFMVWCGNGRCGNN
jgi:hypothetical protein